MIGLALLAVSGGAAILYAMRHREVRVLDDATRTALGGRYIDLAVGKTHYELVGPEGAPVVVLVHGGTIPMWSWDHQMSALQDAGFRVLRYDQLGRGYSDRPDGPYDRALYRTQLEQLLDGLSLSGPLHLVGLSFGATVAVTFAAAHPDRVDRLVLLAPIVHHAEGQLLFHLAKVPGFGEWYARVISVPDSIVRARAFFPASEAARSTKRFDEQTRIAGFESALLSFARTDALGDYRPAHTAAAKGRVLVLRGTDDHQVSDAHNDFLREAYGASLVEVQGGGHGMHEVLADQINTHIAEFLNGPR